ncbi:MAG: ATP synthase F1 subunit gamma [Bdellovibrionota bacterium]
MASTKDLRKRISTTKNTQQTTKAMKMVSAAKLRRAQEAVLAQRPYARRIGSLIQKVAAQSDSPVQSPLLRRDLTDGFKPKALLVLVTSDRGLCGPFNAAVIKAAQKWMMSHSAAYESVELGFIGRKAYDIFKNRNVKIGPYYKEAGGKVVFIKSRKVTDDLIEKYLSGQYDEIKFIYNEFKNAASQEIVTENYLPLEAADALTGRTEIDKMVKDYVVKPSVTQMLETLLAKHFSIQTYRIMLESQASEHGARMSAMENATKNAGEMIRKLTLQYNKQRQAGITKELLEIIAGSESQKQA